MEQTLIGGPPSSGSSLLRTILNRHSEIFCGPETYLFIHNPVYSDWRKYRRRLRGGLMRPMRSRSWFLYNGTELAKSEYGMDWPEIERIAMESDTLPDFCKQFFGHALRREDKRIWMEKSPANVYGFGPFLEQFPTGHVICMYRDPYDITASLLDRGLPAYQAAARCLLAMSWGMKARGHSRYHELRYEDLVRNPEACISKLLEGTELDFEPSMLRATEESRSERTKMPGWTYDETGPIGSGSVGRFDRLQPEDRELLLAAIDALRIGTAYARRFGLRDLDFQAVCKGLSYERRDGTYSRAAIGALQKQRFWYRLRRSARLYSQGLFDHPIIIRP